MARSTTTPRPRAWLIRFILAFSRPHASHILWSSWFIRRRRVLGRWACSLISLWLVARVLLRVALRVALWVLLRVRLRALLWVLLRVLLRVVLVLPMPMVLQPPRHPPPRRRRHRR